VFFEFEAASVLPVDVGARRIEVVDGNTGMTRTEEADIAVPELRLVLEFDGGYAHQGRESSDRRKTAVLEAAGWRVIRFRGAPLERLRPEDVLVARNPTGFDLARALFQAIRADYPHYTAAMEAYLERTGPAAAEAARKVIQAADARRARNARRAAGIVSREDDWSDERLRSAYVDDQMSLPELVEASGYPLPLLRQVLAGIGVDTRRGVRIVGKATPEQVVAMYRDGATIKDIQALTGATQPRISGMLRDAGIIPSTGRPGRKISVSTADAPGAGPSAKVLRELYVDREWTLGRVAAEVGLSVSTVRRLMDEAGVPVRKRGTFRR
jgi:hypothetical protein